MSRFITEPTVFLVSRPSIDLSEWAKSRFNIAEVDSVGKPGGLPIARLLAQEGRSGEALAEVAGRTCTNSFLSGKAQAAYFKSVIEQGQDYILEHAYFSFAVSGVSRAVAQEISRHRVGTAIALENPPMMGSDVRFVIPPGMSEGLDTFKEACLVALRAYEDLSVWSNPEECRQAAEVAACILPGSLETRFLWTVNLRQALHVFKMRGGRGAPLEARRLIVAVWEKLRAEAPHIFSRITRQ